MGFIRAFTGALSGTMADQWLDYYMPASGFPDTALIIPAVKVGTNAGRGQNTKGYENVISNGSKIVVPENTALITIQDGGITGVITEAGGFTYSSDDPNARSIFAGDGIIASTIKSSWEKFKFGGIPSSKQTAIYVNMRGIPDNKFGTQDPVRWMDNFFETQVGGVLRGTYTVKVVDPITFIKNSVPPSYLLPDAPIFDLADMDNTYATELFNNVVASLNQSLQNYASTKARENTGLSSIESIKGDPIGLAKVMGETLEGQYHWRETKGVELVSINILSIDYDQATQELLADFQQDDREVRKAKRMGNVYSQNLTGMMAAASGESMKAAANNPNGAMMGFMGMNMAQQSGADMLNAAGSIQQQMPQYGQPMNGYAQPNMGMQPQYGQPMNGYGQPNMGMQPQYGQPMNGYGQPNMGMQPQYGQPMNQPAQDQNMGVQPQYGQPMNQPAQDQNMGVQPQYGQPMSQPAQDQNMGVQPQYGQPMSQPAQDQNMGVQPQYGQPMNQPAQNQNMGVQPQYGQPMNQPAQDQNMGMQPQYGQQMNGESSQTGIDSSNQ